MNGKTFAARIKRSVDREIESASRLSRKGDTASAFRHLERAHVLGQAVTLEHARVHWLMLKIGWRKRDWREIFGQVFRFVGASTKTPLGIYPEGNTGGANVSPFQPMPIPEDLRRLISEAKRK